MIQWSAAAWPTPRSANRSCSGPRPKQRVEIQVPSDASTHSNASPPNINFRRPCTLGFDSTTILGEPDVWPDLGCVPSAMCWSTGGYGDEWIELRFPSALYVSGLDLHEVWALGSLTRIATTTSYVDDNTVPCQYDTCSKDTTWNTVWQGEAAPVDPVDSTGDGSPNGRIHSPPVRH